MDQMHLQLYRQAFADRILRLLGTPLHKRAGVQVDQWLDFSTSVVSGSGLEAVCGVVNQFLALRTYLVGYQLSIADLKVWGQLHGKLPSTDAE